MGCGLGGGVIDWVMKMDGVSFRHAVALLKEGLPGSAAETPNVSASAPAKRSTVRRLDSPVSLDADDQALLHQVIDYYHATLKQSPDALSYLEQRGIGSLEAIETFKLGYADRTLGLRLPEKTRKAGAEVRGRLVKLGLYRESGHEHFSGSLIMPIVDEAGQVVEVYGRKRRDDLRPGTPKHLYLPGPHRGVWNRPALLASTEIILCEALIDALTFWVAGFRNVTASYGVQGFTEEHLSAFQRYGLQRVLIAYDRDAAGDRAALALAERLVGLGMDCYRVRFPHGQDANATARQSASPHDSLGALIRSAEWLGKGKTVAVASVPAAASGEPDGDGGASMRSAERATEPPALAASVLPPAPIPTPAVTAEGDDLHLTPLPIVNPYAARLTFVDGSTRTRRDHEKYLTLIDTIALLHQHQRSQKTARREGSREGPSGAETLHYLEVTLADIEAANRLAHEVLGRTLDALPPQTRRLLRLTQRWVNDESRRQHLSRRALRFRRRDLREAIGWGDTQLKIHLARLVDLEYLLVHRAPGQSFLYELLYDGPDEHPDDRPHLSGLIDVAQLRGGACGYDADRSGLESLQSVPGRPEVGHRSAGGRTHETTGLARSEATFQSLDIETAETAKGRENSGVLPVVAETGIVATAPLPQAAPVALAASTA